MIARTHKKFRKAGASAVGKNSGVGIGQICLLRQCIGSESRLFVFIARSTRSCIPSTLGIRKYVPRPFSLDGTTGMKPVEGRTCSMRSDIILDDLRITKWYQASETIELAVHPTIMVFIHEALGVE